MLTPTCNDFPMISAVKQRGLAMVIVIWILTLLTLMAGSFAMTMRRDNSVSLAIKSSAEALAYAESGITLAEFMLDQPDPELRWLANGTVYRILKPEVEIRVRVQAETGKVDINSTNATQLAALLNWAVGDEWQSRRLLNAILDWRDADDDTRTQGAEKRQYRLAGLKYGPSNTAFQSLEELQLVLGMNEAVFNTIRPFITVYSGQTEVDLNNASPQLLAIIARELKERNIDDVALKNRMESAEETQEFDESEADDVSVENQTYTIIAEALVRGESLAGLEAVISKQGDEMGQPFQVLDWKQNLQEPSLFDDTLGYPVITIQDEFRYDDRY